MKEEKASAVSDLRGGHDEGLGEEKGATFKPGETESGSTNTSVAELKGTAGYQRGRDAGRCDTVTFASTNGLSGFSRTVWCYAPDWEPRMHLAQQEQMNGSVLTFTITLLCPYSWCWAD